MHGGSCANCGRAIDGAEQKFCPSCGQATPAHRIDWHFLSHELQHGIFHVDKGILFTAKQLILRPGRFIRDYIDGKRANHFKPVLMIMITGAIVAFVAHQLLGLKLMGNSVAVHVGTGADAPTAAESQFLQYFMAVGSWLESHFSLSAVLLVPVMALAFKLAFRRMRQINYPEWLVITCYLTAQNFLIYLAWLPLHKLFGLGTELSTLAMVIANSLTMAQFFAPGYSRLKSIVRSLLAYGLYFAAVIVFIAAAGVVIGIRAGLIERAG